MVGSDARLAGSAFMLVLIGAASSAAAQDYTAWGSSYAANVGVTGAAERSARSAPTRNPPRSISITRSQAKACANRSRFRAEYGADHPQVRQLERLCAAAGY
jgi:hypothetical protein